MRSELGESRCACLRDTVDAYNRGHINEKPREGGVVLNPVGSETPGLFRGADVGRL